MSTQAVTVSNAPAAAGPHSRGIVAGGFEVTGGFGPQHPATGQIFAGGVNQQTRRVRHDSHKLRTVKGTTLDERGRACAELLTAPHPWHTTVGSTLTHVLVEIEVVAPLPEARR